MITIHIPGDQLQRLRAELRRAGSREIGGVLAGEHLQANTFQIAALSVQRNGGTSVSFVRDPKFHARFMREFFDRVGHNYERCNYHWRMAFAPFVRPLSEHYRSSGDAKDR